MIVRLEEIDLSAGRFLTEITWEYSDLSLDKTFTLHYFLDHPGADEVDELFSEIDPGYTPPKRYAPWHVIHALAVDSCSQGDNPFVFATSQDVSDALLHYLEDIPHPEGQKWTNVVRVLGPTLAPTVENLLKQKRERLLEEEYDG